MFAANTVYVVGASRSQQNNAIMHQYGRFLLGFIIDKNTGRILACDVTTALPLTEQFLRSVFCEKNILTDDKLIQEEIETRYIGSSQKAILVAFRHAQKRFQMTQKGDFKGAVEANPN